jgi:hypothetical protein
MYEFNTVISLFLIFAFTQAPASRQSSFFLLGDYVNLAKTRLKDLNEALEFGLFGPGLVSVI